MSEIGKHLIAAIEVYFFLRVCLCQSLGYFQTETKHECLPEGVQTTLVVGIQDANPPKYWLVVLILGRGPLPPPSSKVSLPSLFVWQAYFSVAVWSPSFLWVSSVQLLVLSAFDFSVAP